MEEPSIHEKNANLPGLDSPIFKHRRMQMSLRVVFIVGFLMWTNGSVKGQNKLTSKNKTYETYCELARLLSMDNVWKLAKVDKKFLQKKVKEYARLMKLRGCPDTTLAKIAHDTVRFYLSIERVHVIYNPPKNANLADLFLTVMTRLSAAGSVAQDNERSQKYFKSVWPTLVPYAKKFAGPEVQKQEVLKPVLATKLLKLGALVPGEKYLEIQNSSGKNLTNATLQVQATDVWGSQTEKYYYYSSWNIGEIKDTLEVGDPRLITRVKYSLYSDQLQKTDAVWKATWLKKELLANRDQFQKVWDTCLVWTGKSYRGRKMIGYVKMHIVSFMPSARVGGFPTVRAAIVDYRKVRRTWVQAAVIPLSVSYEVEFDNDQIKGFRARLTSRFGHNFLFSAKDDESVIGESSKGITIRLTGKVVAQPRRPGIILK